MTEAPPRRIVSSANWEWLEFSTPMAIFNPLSSPLFCKAYNFLLVDLATMRYKKGDRGQPWRSPREAWKNPTGLPLTNRAIQGLPTQALIHLHKFFENPNLSMISNKRKWWTLSKAFSISSLMAIPCFLHSMLEWMSSWTMFMLSMICLLAMKHPCVSEIIFAMIFFILLARILAIIL